jgi:hypothetical protein
MLKNKSEIIFQYQGVNKAMYEEISMKSATKIYNYLLKVSN